ncbi:hypothetical protein ABPG74_016128 [Tetrahymena malaccensis]
MNQKCNCCGILSDELNCYNCYKKIRNIFVPSPQVMVVQKKFIDEHQQILYEQAKEKFQDLVNLNTIERISIYQKKLCEIKDDIQDLEEFKQMIQIQTKEIEQTNQYKKKRIELLKAYLENVKQEQKKAKEDLEKRQSILMNLKKRKVEMAYNLRVINYQFPNWSINSELEKIEIPFQNKKSNKVEKSYQNYILFKKKWNFLTQVQQQQFIFSMNQIALFIYCLQTIFKISSQFPLQKKPREQISVATTENIKIYDENFRMFYDENIIYLYLNYKLILQRFNINRTRNPYFFFDFSYFKERFFARQNVIQNQKDKLNQDSNNTSYQLLKIISQDSQEVLDTSFQSYTELISKQKQENKIIDLDLVSNTHNQLEQTIYNKVTCKTPQKSLISNNLTHSDQHLAIPQENQRIRSLSHLEETFKQTKESQNNRNQIQHTTNFNQDQGKTFRLLFIKSPLIKIEYEDNLKQKEFGFKEPYIYAAKKVVSGGWELYDNEEY